MAHRALAPDISVSEEPLALVTVELVNHLVEGVTIGVEVLEDFLSDLGVDGRGCPSEVVKVDVEPLINLLVDNVVLVADLLRGLAFLLGFGLGRGSVLIGTTDVHAVVVGEAAVPCVGVS